MKKIGILTWFSACNYGARAHSLALRKTIESLGYQCEMVAYYPPNDKIVNFKANINASHKWMHPLLALNAAVRCLNFSKAVSLNPVSPVVKTGMDIDNLHYDAIVLGSDEVFKPEHPTHSPIYYGVGIKETPLITYAPSAGQTDVNYRLSDDVRISLQRILRLSVRDFHTEELIYNNTGLKAKVVADPTILYDFKEEAIIPTIRDYVLVYAFDRWDEYGKEICDYAHRHEMKVVSLARKRKWADISWDQASVQEWFGAYMNAALLVTDSFHGTVFSVKNNVPFILLARGDKLNKINDFLSSIHIERAYYNTSSYKSLDDYLSMQSINWKDANTGLEKIKAEALDYLSEALQAAMTVTRCEGR